MKLSDIQFAALDLVIRYGLGITERFSRLPQFADTEHSTDSVLEALRCRHGYLRREHFYGNKTYYHVTKQLAEDFDYPKRACRPLKEKEKAEAFARLAFCTPDDAGINRQRLTKDDFQRREDLRPFFEATPEHSRGRNASKFENYYASCGRIGYLRVDRGGYGRWDRLAGKCLDIIQTHRRIPEYRHTIENRNFELGVVTCFQNKADRTLELITEHELSDGVHVVIEVVPELLNLLHPPPRI